MFNGSLSIRQGDVYLHRVDKLPEGATLLPGQNVKIVLALGEATGHHHRIEDHVIELAAAAEITEALIARHQVKARLYEHAGDRYLVVDEPVTLLHEEHLPQILPPGIYELPQQMEYDASIMRRVAD